MLKPKYVICLAVVGISFWLLWRSATPLPTKFPLKIPTSAKLLHSFRHVGGDNSKTYAFVFEVTDQSLLNHLIDEWNLVDRSSSHFSGSFASMVAEYWEVTWWPNCTELEAMPIRFEFNDDGSQFYRKVYRGNTSDRLYVEYGNW